MRVVLGVVRAQREGKTRKRPARRATFAVAAIEALESRSLLSAAAAIESTPLELSSSDQKAALVVISVPMRQAVPANSVEKSAQSTTNDDRGRASKRDEGIPQGSISIGKSASGTSDATRRSNQTSWSQRQSVDSLVSAYHSADVESHEPSTDGQLLESEPITSTAASDGADPAVPASVVGSSLEFVSSVMIAAPGPQAGLGGFEARIGALAPASAATNPLPGPSVFVTPALENAVAPSVDPRAVSVGLVDESSAPGVSAIASGSTSPTYSAADLLDATIHPDWDSVDGDLRQFLTRLGGLADSRDLRPSGPVWPVWLGTAAALFVARRASRRRRRMFRRSCARESLCNGRRPIPVGPWPLGLP